MELLLQVFYSVETSIEVYRTRLDALLRHMPAQLTLKVATVQHGVTTSQKIVSF